MQEHTQEQPPITFSVCYWRQHSHRCLAGCLPSARSSSTVRYSSTRGWSRCHPACAGRSMLYVPLCSCSLCCPAYRWWPGQRSDWSHLDKEKNKTNQFHLFSVIKNKRQRSLFFFSPPFCTKSAQLTGYDVSSYRFCKPQTCPGWHLDKTSHIMFTFYANSCTFSHQEVETREHFQLWCFS